MSSPPPMDTWQRIARRIRVPSGFLFAALYVYAIVHLPPTWRSFSLGLLLVLPGLLLRGYAAGYVKKNRELTTTGPYAYTRNPLYLGSLSIALGFAVASRNVWIFIGLAALLLFLYIPVIASEERFLRATFPGFDAYCSQVPRLLPRLSPAQSAGTAGSFSWALYRKHREYRALLGALALYALLVLRLLNFHA